MDLFKSMQVAVETSRGEKKAKGVFCWMAEGKELRIVDAGHLLSETTAHEQARETSLQHPTWKVHVYPDHTHFQPVAVYERGKCQGAKKSGTKKSETMWVCSRLWLPGKTVYVSGTPHKRGSKAALRHGVDWGYETDASKAVPINTYWKRRFEADMRYVGAEGVNCRAVK